MTDCNVRIVIDRTEGQGRAVGVGVPQGSPVSPILFAIYISGVFEGGGTGDGAEGLSFVDDVAWVATGKDVEEVIAKLEACAAAAGEGEAEEVHFRRGWKEMPAREDQAGNHQVAGNSVAGCVSRQPAHP